MRCLVSPRRRESLIWKTTSLKKTNVRIYTYDRTFPPSLNKWSFMYAINNLECPLLHYISCICRGKVVHTDTLAIPKCVTGSKTYIAIHSLLTPLTPHNSSHSVVKQTLKRHTRCPDFSQL